MPQSAQIGPAMRKLGLLFALLVPIGVPVSAQEDGNETAAPRRILLCSTTQIADFARNVVGDRWIVESILAPRQDPHLYEVTPNDSQRVRRADLCLENGLHLEGSQWMRNLATSEGKPLVTCTQGIAPLTMEVENSTESVPDPHAWFTPKNGAIYVRNIARAVSEVDPAHQAEYQSRARLYLDQLRALDLWIIRECNRIPEQQRVLVTSHDAFKYFCQEYGFTSAAPAGWSTGPEIGGGVTPERRRQTVESIRTLGVPAIFVETSVNPKLVREIAAEAGVTVGGELYSDSMGGAGTAGETYIGMMRENVLAIVGALAVKP